MGKRNYLIEGGSGTGKTSVAEELQRRGYHVIHGDRELKYRGDPKTGEPLTEPVHRRPVAAPTRSAPAQLGAGALTRPRPTRSPVAHARRRDQPGHRTAPVSRTVTTDAAPKLSVDDRLRNGCRDAGVQARRAESGDVGPLWYAERTRRPGGQRPTR